MGDDIKMGNPADIKMFSQLLKGEINHSQWASYLDGLDKERRGLDLREFSHKDFTLRDQVNIIKSEDLRGIQIGTSKYPALIEGADFSLLFPDSFHFVSVANFRDVKINFAVPQWNYKGMERRLDKEDGKQELIKTMAGTLKRVGFGGAEQIAKMKNVPSYIKDNIDAYLQDNIPNAPDEDGFSFDSFLDIDGTVFYHQGKPINDLVYLGRGQFKISKSGGAKDNFNTVAAEGSVSVKEAILYDRNYILNANNSTGSKSLRIKENMKSEAQKLETLESLMGVNTISDKMNLKKGDVPSFKSSQN